MLDGDDLASSAGASLDVGPAWGMLTSRLSAAHVGSGDAAGGTVGSSFSVDTGIPPSLVVVSTTGAPLFVASPSACTLSSSLLIESVILGTFVSLRFI